MRHTLPAVLLLVVSTSALPAKIDPATRNALADQCVETYGNVNPPPPPEAEKSIPPLKYRKDPQKLREFCICQTDMYHEQIPQADYDAWLKELAAGKGDGPASKRVYSKATERADAADKMCDEKMSKK